MKNKIVETENGNLQAILIGWDDPECEPRMVVYHNNKFIGTFWVSALNILNNELNKRLAGPGLMLFSRRRKLADYYEQWVNQELDCGRKIKDCPVSVITFLTAMGLLEYTTDSVLEKRWHKLKKQVDSNKNKP